MPRRLAPLCGAGRFPPALFMGQIVFVELFAPVSLHALKDCWQWRGSDLPVAWSIRKDHKGMGPTGEVSLSQAPLKSKIVVLFYFIFKIGCATVCWVFLPSWLLVLVCSYHYVPCQLAHEVLLGF